MKPSATRMRAASSVAGDVGEERALVADHLELHELGAEQLAAEARGGDGVLGGVAAGRVRQDREALGRDEVEQALALRRVELRAPQRHRHHLGAGRLGAGQVLLERGVLAAADDQARAEAAVAERVGRPTSTASHRLEDLDAVAARELRARAKAERGTTSRFTATATRRVSSAEPAQQTCEAAGRRDAVPLAIHQERQLADLRSDVRGHGRAWWRPSRVRRTRRGYRSRAAAPMSRNALPFSSDTLCACIGGSGWQRVDESRQRPAAARPWRASISARCARNYAEAARRRAAAARVIARDQGRRLRARRAARRARAGGRGLRARSPCSRVEEAVAPARRRHRGAAARARRRPRRARGGRGGRARAWCRCCTTTHGLAPGWRPRRARAARARAGAGRGRHRHATHGRGRGGRGRVRSRRWRRPVARARRAPSPTWPRPTRPISRPRCAQLAPLPRRAGPRRARAGIAPGLVHGLNSAGPARRHAARRRAARGDRRSARAACSSACSPRPHLPASLRPVMTPATRVVQVQPRAARRGASATTRAYRAAGDTRVATLRSATPTGCRSRRPGAARC